MPISSPAPNSESGERMELKSPSNGKAAANKRKAEAAKTDYGSTQILVHNDEVGPDETPSTYFENEPFT